MQTAIGLSMVTDPMATSVPFSSDDFLFGLGQIQGLAKPAADGTGIEIQWQAKGRLAKILRSKIRTRTIPLADIEGVTFKRGMVGGKLLICTRDLRAAEGIPGADSNTVTLSIQRRDRKDAESFAGELSLLLSERDLEKAATAAGLPLPETPS